MESVRRRPTPPTRLSAPICVGALLLMAWTAAAAAATDDPAAASSAVDSIRAQLTARQLDAAQARTQQLLIAAESRSKSHPLELAELLGLLVEIRVAQGAGAQPQTRELADRALAVTEAAVGPDDPLTATRLEHVAHLARLGDELATARSLYERALHIRERAQGQEHADVAATLGNLAYIVEISGDLDGAQRLYERALHIAERARGERHPDVAVALADLAGLLRAKSEYAQAKPMLERALAIREATLDATDPDIVHSLTGLGILSRDLGDLPAARVYFERALRVREQGLGPEHPDLARYINNLASLLAESGELAAARPLFERALAIRTKALGPEHRDVGSSTNNLASLLLQIGDYAAARPLFERALTIWEKTLGPEHPNVAISLDNLAHLSGNDGDLETARRLHTRSLAIKEQAFGPEHPSVAITVDDLANVAFALGDLAQARALHERALAIKEKSLGSEHPEVARGRDNLGSTLYAAGEYARARQLHEQALEMRRKSLGPQHPDVALSLRNCAISRLAQGDVVGAFGFALEAEQIGRDHLRLTSRSLGEREALRYAATRYGALDLVLQLAGEPGAQLGAEAAERAWDAAIRSRAIVLDEMAARHRAAVASSEPEIDSLAAAVQAAREQVASLTVRGAGDETPDEYRRQVETATRAKEAAERALAERSSRFQAELSRARIGLREVLEALPPSAALLAYCRFTPPRLPSTGQATRPDAAGGDAAYLALVGRNQAGVPLVEAVRLGAAAPIDSLAAAWRREAGSFAWNDRTGEREAACRRVGDALRRLVWDPIAPRVAGAELVLVVPDGRLHLVNLAALPVGDRDYLVERQLLHVLSTERDLLRMPAPVGHGLLAVGDPDYDRANSAAGSRVPQLLAMLTPFRGARPDCSAFEELRFAPLPQSRREIGDVRRMWKRSHRDEAGVELTGRHADESSVKAALPGKRVVHLATHGFFLGDDCPPSDLGGVMRHAGSTTASSTPLATASLENPLLLSGLALAGSNLREQSAPDTEDGVLTAEEVASLDLRGVEWAVLSACDTATGDVRAGEGVFGLRRAFETAGASTLIMSLWAVEDETGRAWMEELYRARFDDGLSTAQAVQQADLRILAKRRAKRLSTHPSVWAGFIAAGDWR